MNSLDLSRRGPSTGANSSYSNDTLFVLIVNAECRVALQYCGWNLHDGVALASGASGPSENESVISASQAPCPECGKSLQVEGSGLYGCPICGCRFHADVRGRTTPYESLGLSK